MQRTLQLVVAGMVMASLGLATSAAYAERHDITIKAPGVQMREKKGWFGTRSTQYGDAMGNNYSHSKGIFSGESTSGGIMGSRISQSRSGIFGTKNTTVTGPDNQVMVQQSRGILGGKSTTVDANAMWQNVRDIFGSNTYTAPNMPNP